MRALTAAARSSWPAGAVDFAAGTRGAVPPAVGRGAVGTGGLLGTLGAGLDPTAGAGGFGFTPTGGGGLLARELDGRESESSVVVNGVFFHGAADPLAGAIPGNTDTGFADALAVSDWTGTFAVVGLVALAGVGTGRPRGGAGGAAGPGLGSTNSK